MILIGNCSLLWYFSLHQQSTKVREKYWIEIVLNILNIYFYYNLLIKILVINKRTNLGNINLENTYIIITINIKANVTWFIK